MFLLINNNVHGSFFGSFSQGSVKIKAVKHGRYVLFDPNLFLYQSGKAYLQEF